ncbi:hypothetical protein SERLA73DRAFT_170556 [Serpula lacrymans var. lacrymans S7.3]|uniref:Major facilitator superfamily (MFS) profile domain-containing protein n=1 Tax=Serpula lacrymans var. lacrymans (strain S7.3) TaxID=936435 RepID=F8Q6A2_SERL3|nr:hypothetical protein SERLA73DRAFT_170556 [Serpula lacrymans var. lacrymans S7.3]
MVVAQHDNQSFTKYGWSVCFWVLVVSFQYGYHTSALNQIQAVLTCREYDENTPFHHGLPTCIPMSDTAFSVVTAIFTIGGLCGSLSSNIAMDRWGRKGASRLSAVLTASGACMSGLSPSVAPLILGRFLVGAGAGIGLCVGPIYLSEIAPSKLKGNIGVLTQLAIVIGIMFTQALGLRLATSTQWRYVLLISCALSAIQLFSSPFVVESPVYLNRQGLIDEQKLAIGRIWGTSRSTLRPDPERNDSEQPLLSNTDDHEEGHHETAVTVPRLLVTPELRRPLLIIVFAMLTQQLSGINAVLYYSNDILSKSLPEVGPYVSLGITVMNALMTFPPIFLIERVGRKQLFQMSVAGAILSHAVVGLGLNSGLVALSSVAIITFVMSFAIGLGPIPFVIIPEVAPAHAVSAVSSVGLSLNWVANFIVGLLFLPVRNLLASGDPSKEGRVFYVFAVVLFLTASALSRVYRG